MSRKDKKVIAKAKLKHYLSRLDAAYISKKV